MIIIHFFSFSKKEFGQPKAYIEAKKKQPPNSDIQSSLKQEVYIFTYKLCELITVAYLRHFLSFEQNNGTSGY